MDDFADQPLDYSNPTPLTLTPVDGDPFATPKADAGVDADGYRILDVPVGKQKVTLTPVDHDPFAAPPAPEPQQFDQNGNLMGYVPPSLQETASDPNNPIVQRYAAAIPYAIGQMASGIVGAPQAALQLGNQVQQEAQQSSPASTDQPIQAATPSPDSVAQSTNLAAGFIAPQMQFAEPGALGVAGGRSVLGRPGTLQIPPRRQTTSAADPFASYANHQLDEPREFVPPSGADTAGIDAIGNSPVRTSSAIKAVHESPHDFEQFDLSKSGTGEGAITGRDIGAYGHGVYLSGVNANPRNYRNFFNTHFGRSNTYNVDINRIPDHFIRYNMPSSDYINSVVKTSFPDIRIPRGTENTGEYVQGILSQKYGPIQASKMLSDAGIAGVEHAQGPPDVNGVFKQGQYVVFDPKDVAITHKNGVPVPAYTPVPRRPVAADTAASIPNAPVRSAGPFQPPAPRPPVDLTPPTPHPDWSPNAVQYLNNERDHLASIGQPQRASTYNDILANGPGALSEQHVGNSRAQQAYDTAMGKQPQSPEVSGLMSRYKTDPRTAAVFQQHLDKAGLPADQFLDTMFGQSNNHEITTSYNGELSMQSGIRDKDGNYVGLIQRSMDPKTNTADHAFFEISSPDNQGKGLARQMLRRQIPLYQKMGLDAVTTHANIDVGGYAWARYGFAPEKSSLTPLFRQINENLYKLEDSGHLSSDVGMDVRNMMNRGDPKSVWKIADITTPVKLPDGTMSTVGKQALLGTSWHGKLDLKDPATMERFNAYVK